MFIGFTKPELFPARIKNAKNCNFFGEAFPQVLFLKVLSATATKQLTLKQIVSLENQFVCVKQYLHDCFFGRTFTDTGNVLCEIHHSSSL